MVLMILSGFSRHGKVIGRYLFGNSTVEYFMKCLQSRYPMLGLKLRPGKMLNCSNRTVSIIVPSCCSLDVFKFV